MMGNSLFRKTVCMFIAFVVAASSFGELRARRSIVKKRRKNSDQVLVFTAEEEKEIDHICSDFEYIFEETSEYVSGKYYVCEPKMEQKFGIAAVTDIVKFVDMVNEHSYTEPVVVTIHHDSVSALLKGWVDCVIEKVVNGTGVAFLVSGMRELIEQKAWEKLAKEIIKVVGKNAIKGGVVGLVTSFVWFSTVCALEDDE